MDCLAKTLGVGTPVSPLSVELALGDTARCIVVHGFLSASECEAFVVEMETLGFSGAGGDYPPSYRDNERLVTDDPALAQQLFKRLLHCATQAPTLSAVLAEKGWQLVGVNERLRFCRYTPGTQFRAHQDGVHHRQQAQSRLTFMVYLNDEAFSGGETVFFDNRSAALAGRDALLRLKPRKGSLIVFDHSLWHAGAVVESGRKYIMRSDLMYAPHHVAKASGTFQPGHHGYVWALANVGDRGFASAGRDTTIRLWDQEGRCQGTLNGHKQSVLGLLQPSPGELLSHSRDRTIRKWSLATGKSTVLGTSASAVLASTLLDRHHLVTGDADGCVTVWNLATGVADTRQAHACWVWAIAPLSDGSFGTAAEDGAVKLWRREGKHCTQVIQLERPLRTLASWVDADGSAILAAGDIDGQVHLLAPSPTLARVDFFCAHDGPVRRVRFDSRNGLLTCGEDGWVKRWDLLLRQYTVVGRHENFATDVLPIGSGRWISCGYDGQIIRHGTDHS